MSGELRPRLFLYIPHESFGVVTEMFGGPTIQSTIVFLFQWHLVLTSSHKEVLSMEVRGAHYPLTWGLNTSAICDS